MVTDIYEAPCIGSFSSSSAISSRIFSSGYQAKPKPMRAAWSDVAMCPTVQRRRACRPKKRSSCDRLEAGYNRSIPGEGSGGPEQSTP
jgi:hypothetical protein